MLDAPRASACKPLKAVFSTIGTSPDSGDACLIGESFDTFAKTGPGGHAANSSTVSAAVVMEVNFDRMAFSSKVLFSYGFNKVV